MRQYRRHLGVMICSLALLLIAQPGVAADLSGNWEVDGDKMKGDASWDTYAMTFTASKK